MSQKIVPLIIAIIIVVGIGYWIYQLTSIPEGLTEIEKACINSGGKISTSLCCKSTEDFPNLCLIGPCGCSLNNSHQVKICDYGANKCFNGTEYVSLEIGEETPLEELTLASRVVFKLDFLFKKF